MIPTSLYNQGDQSKGGAITRISAGLGLAVVMLTLCGCYKHVIRDTSFGNQSDVYEPNAPDPDQPTVIDRWLDSEK